MKKILLTALALTATTLAFAEPSLALTDDERVMLNEVQKVTDQYVRYCHEGRANDDFLFAAVAVPAPVQNPFTPQLTPPGGPQPGSIGGYYQLSLFPSSKGNKIPRLDWHPNNVADFQRRNGIEAQYSLDFYAQSYRIYDVRTHAWGLWTNAGSFGSNVHYASFTAEKRNGQWNIKGGFLINTTGVVKAPASCADVPGG
jgi:hypothetical protein